ncbi:MAG: cytochrome b/b6 domain-containing protein [gamma proteobacterium symbiont of Bathyaustriella thionipta]|nr:cytochrome b/b6 domain-containing protein [gamma proteobacterium symbiont of Bathyaustriella thionipta]MCU7950279.1 cytochrome b/b6 domain-containing protein [gamma proteobacterium symbiont of Bathyaustriella thionipta]MCU7951810.1 cytochrome b/b6 domain-containing protein [gamma proteobacterium symbiont of Bathyaustriella thionipta]MCU7966991.1 cytochrome b/b6 domain-containing protein [gamma proteobacterium symbiont of Bathyaustriella thionipta]
MNLQQEKGKQNPSVRVWDIPVRLFHWIFASCFIIAWLTLDNRYLDIHVFAGYLMGGLILFRILWGFIGGPYASFHDFTFSGSEVSDYFKGVLKRCPPRFLGHNPAGSWAIFLLLGLGLSITVTGLLTLGGEEQQGPLAGYLNYSQGHLAHELHDWLAWLMLGMVIIHLAGVLIESLLHRENLVAAMLTGCKSSDADAVSTASHWKVGVTMLVIIISAGIYWFQGYLTETPEQPYQPFLGPVLPDNSLWREECGACHLAFHPSLLPARSWKSMMEQQASHFEEDLYLEEDTLKKIEAFLIENAAEQGLTEAAWKINRSIAKTEVLLRITQTDYWLKKHQDISDAVWEHPKVSGKFNCAACHMDAEAGTFEDAAMSLPDNVEAQ